MIESGGNVLVTLYTSGDVTSTTGIVVTLDYTGTAIDGIDYDTGVTQVIIPAGQTGYSFTLNTLDDVNGEGDESFTVSITGVLNASEFNTQTETVTIIDDDIIIFVAMSVNTGAIDENNGSAIFTLYTSGDMIHNTGMVITLAYTGTASGVDYASVTTATILSGSTGTTFVLTGLDDLIVEGTETIIVDIVSILNGFESGVQNQTITVLDDDAAQVLLTVNTGAINENG